MISNKKDLIRLYFKYLLLIFSLASIFASDGLCQTNPATFTKEGASRSQISIQGHVTNEIGTPIEGALLSVKWADIESTSDVDGKFKIFNVHERDTISVKHPHYQLLEFIVEKGKVNYFISLKNGKNVISNIGSDYQKSELIDIHGMVSDEAGNAQTNTVVIVTGTNHGTATDSIGQFKLLRIPVNGKLSVSHVGFTTKEVDVEKHKTKYEIALKRVVNVLGEMVVVGYNLNIKSAQSLNADSNAADNLRKDLVMVEQNPEFPGGTQALYRYLGQNIHYPVEAARAGIHGLIFVLFSINETGDIRNPRIDQGLGAGIDEEALRVVLNMPRWNPAKQMGQTVSVDYKMPIHFQLESNTLKEKK